MGRKLEDIISSESSVVFILFQDVQGVQLAIFCNGLYCDIKSSYIKLRAILFLQH